MPGNQAGNQVGNKTGSSGESDVSSQDHSDRRDWLIGVGVSALITLIFGLVNWHWLQVNVVTYGWDRLDHLITTLVFNNMLSSPGPSMLYDLLAYASYYPPLVHYTAAAAYQLFGVSEEIAVMANLLFLFALLLVTWAIARRLSNTASEATTGVLAAFILATFPMIFAMSRYLSCLRATHVVMHRWAWTTVVLMGSTSCPPSFIVASTSRASSTR